MSRSSGSGSGSGSAKAIAYNIIKWFNLHSNRNSQPSILLTIMANKTTVNTNEIFILRSVFLFGWRFFQKNCTSFSNVKTMFVDISIDLKYFSLTYKCTKHSTSNDAISRKSAGFYSNFNRKLNRFVDINYKSFQTTRVNNSLYYAPQLVLCKSYHMIFLG